ncbi:MAG: HDIG domain-containing protein [Proteobacteria bacterium]|nr:HDIG domain-containing protein [Pseudomonadota bacterium]
MSGGTKKTPPWLNSILPRARETAKRVDKAKNRLPVIQRLPLRRIALVGALVVVLTVLLWPDLPFVRHEYKIGETAGRDILADRNYRIVDTAATAELRRRAAGRAREVFDFDETAVRRLSEGLANSLAPLAAFFSRARLAYEARLRSAVEAKLAVRDRLRELATGGPADTAGWPIDLLGLPGPLIAAQLAVLGLPPLRLPVSGPDLLKWILSQPRLKKKLVKLESRFEHNLVRGLVVDLPPQMRRGLRRAGYGPTVQRAVARVLAAEMSRGVVGHASILSRERTKGLILRNIPSRRERVVKDVFTLIDLRQAYRRISARYRVLVDRFPPGTAQAVVFLARTLLRPNVTINTAETVDRRARAMKAVKPKIMKIFRGDVIVSRGERITAADRVKLQALREANPLGKTVFVTLWLVVLLLALLHTTYRVGARHFGSASLRLQDMTLLVVSLVLVAIMARAGGFVAAGLPKDLLPINPLSFVWLAPVAFGGIMVSVFMGVGAAVLFALCAAVVGAWVMPQQIYYFLFVLVGSLVGAMAVHQAQGRTRFILAGAFTGGMNVLVVAGQLLIHDSFFHLQGLIGLAFAFLGGLLSGVLAAGLVPLAEMLLGYTTDVKLLELASLDRPALRELMVQAPGTYHHSIVVGNLVEAAAKEIGANPLLAKVAAYYHDIGKTRKPLYFVENQTDAVNRHEKLAPSMSALILISHVKDGVDLAGKNGLGREIIDIIRQHHGTSVIKYFYQKALDRVDKDKGQKQEVNIENFRYPGPKPQTKEAGLVMLADAVEAASKTLVDPTPSRVQGMVQKIVNTIFGDGQLDECELTLKDLHKIARNFNQVLAGLFHHRIEYPETADVGTPARRKTNGNINQRPSNGGQDQPSRPEAADKQNLKRLGID